MNTYITADEAYVDTDEGRYILRIFSETGDVFTVDIHSFSLEFYASVQAELRPYVLEAEAARTMPQPVTVRPLSVEDAIEAGYALDDPKSPGYYERMVD